LNPHYAPKKIPVKFAADGKVINRYLGSFAVDDPKAYGIFRFGELAVCANRV
jgi:hypothetical protein